MGFFIFGMPGENEERMEATIKLAIELDPDLANFMIASPYPGTELYDIITNDGKFREAGYESLAIHSDKAHFSIGEVTPELVERKWHEAYRRFYLRPHRIWRRLKMADTWRNWRVYANAARRFFVNGNPEYAQTT
jgi:radical SAM superfamily enzyme YgiQ (UPF0313 family)